MKNISGSFLTILLLFSGIIMSLETQARNLDVDKIDKSPIVNITTSNFNKEVAKGIVLVDFWAPWCGPCRQMNPILESLADEYNDSVKFAKMNVDNNKRFVTQNGIKSIPTIIIYSDGKEVNRIVGLVSKEELKKVLDKYTKK